MKNYTTAEYAYEHGLSRWKARAKLKLLVAQGRAVATHNVVIGHMSRFTTKGRSEATTPIRGTVWTVFESGGE